MIFGARAFFGYVPHGSRGTVWFANVPRHLASREERDTTTTEHWKRWLIEHFERDRGPAAELITAGELQLVADNMHDMPSVPSWHNDRMIIIGDAAHAPSPSSGQGASMALEDGVMLAKCLRDVRVSATRSGRSSACVVVGSSALSRKERGAAAVKPRVRSDESARPDVAVRVSLPGNGEVADVDVPSTTSTGRAESCPVREWPELLVHSMGTLGPRCPFERSRVVLGC